MRGRGKMVEVLLITKMPPYVQKELKPNEQLFVGERFETVDGSLKFHTRRASGQPGPDVRESRIEFKPMRVRVRKK